jgi:hypothetical protein
MSANVGDVDAVMVAGDLVKENGVLLNVELKSLKKRIEDSKIRITSSANDRGFKTGELVAENFFPLNPFTAMQLKVAGPMMRIPFMNKLLMKFLIQKTQKRI